MTEEELERERQRAIIRAKYRNLLHDLQRIKGKVDKFYSNYQELEDSLEANVLVDEKKYDEKNFTGIRKEIESIKSDLSTNLIPRVANKS